MVCRDKAGKTMMPLFREEGESMKVLFLPVDSRPCNRLFPKQILEWCGATCIEPPPDIFDHFTQPSNWEGIKQFLIEHAEEADVWAISMDQLCYGSLLSSRSAVVTEEEVKERLAWFEAFRNQYPEKPVHVINTILRTSISTLKTSDLQVYHAMTEYSYWSDKASITGSMEDMARSEQAARRIPTDVILQYHSVRQRNHMLNARCVELTKRGIFSSLLLLMEDSEEYGFHRAEQRVLVEKIADDPRITIKNGTDEGPLLAMKCLMPQPISLSIQWIGREDGKFIARYEDRPFEENVARALAYLGIENDPESKTVLAIAANEEGVQVDMVITEYATTPSYPKEAKQAADRINELLQSGYDVYLLDQFCCNGGWPEFTRQIDHPEKLSGYSAWNTASNALATLLGQLCSDTMAGKKNLRFRNERFLDDLLYESCIRSQLNHMLRAYGQDPYHLSDPEDAERQLREMFEDLFSQRGGWTKRFANIVRLIKETGPYRVSLPWERTFEVEAHQDD